MFVRSIEPHGRLVTVVTTTAETMPGVVAVLTGDDLSDVWVLPPRLPTMNTAMVRPMMAKDVVRFVGEPVAVVLAESKAQAVDAAEAVVVDTEALPAVVELEDSLRGEVLVHEHAGTNVAFEWAMPPFETDPFAACDVVDEFTIRHPRLHVGALEPALLRPQHGDPMGAARSGCARSALQARSTSSNARSVWSPARCAPLRRRRRRVRLERRVRVSARGRGGRVGVAPAGSAGSLGRDTIRIDARDGAWPVVDSSRTHRWHPRRQGSGVRGNSPAGQRGVPGDGNLHHHQSAQLRHRRVRHPRGTCQRPLGGDQHCVDDGTARCRASRGVVRCRTCDGPIRRADRP